jgi:hypothetical protein
VWFDRVFRAGVVRRAVEAVVPMPPDVPAADPDSEVEDTPEGSDDDDPAFDPFLDDLGV